MEILIRIEMRRSVGENRKDVEDLSGFLYICTKY